MLDPVDDMLIGLIRFPPMGCGRDHYYGRFTNIQPAHPVLCNGHLQSPFFFGLCQYLVDHLCGQRVISFILQVGNIPSFIVVTHFAAEQDDGTGRRMMGAAQQCHHVQRGRRDDLAIVRTGRANFSGGPANVR